MAVDLQGEQYLLKWVKALFFKKCDFLTKIHSTRGSCGTKGLSIDKRASLYVWTRCWIKYTWMQEARPGHSLSKRMYAAEGDKAKPLWRSKGSRNRCKCWCCKWRRGWKRFEGVFKKAENWQGAEKGTVLNEDVIEEMGCKRRYESWQTGSRKICHMQAEAWTICQPVSYGYQRWIEIWSFLGHDDEPSIASNSGETLLTRAHQLPFIGAKGSFHKGSATPTFMEAAIITERHRVHHFLNKEDVILMNTMVWMLSTMGVLNELGAQTNGKMVSDSAQEKFITTFPIGSLLQFCAELQQVGLTILHEMPGQLIVTPLMWRVAGIRHRYMGMKQKHIFKFLISKITGKAGEKRRRPRRCGIRLW